MARWIIVLLPALVLVGCDSSSRIEVQNDTGRKMHVRATFKPARPEERAASVDAELQSKESVLLLDHVPAPSGDLMVVIDGVRREKATIPRAVLAQSIRLQISDTGVWLDREAYEPGRSLRSGLISCIVAPFAAIAIFFLLGIRKISRPPHPEIPPEMP